MIVYLLDSIIGGSPAWALPVETLNLSASNENPKLTKQLTCPGRVHDVTDDINVLFVLGGNGGRLLQGRLYGAISTTLGLIPHSDPGLSIFNVEF